MDSNERRTYSRRKFIGQSLFAYASLMGYSIVNMSFKENKQESGSDVDLPITIIGTGYGAAVSALRLAEKGFKVQMLEMGKLWDKTGKDGKIFNKMTKPDGRAMWLKEKTQMPIKRFLYLGIVNQKIPKYVGVLDRVEYPEMNVYVGRGVGGGSLVNGGMSVVPKRSYFEKVFPDINADQMYEKFFPLVNKHLGVSLISDDFLQNSKYYKYTRTALETAHDAGFKTIRVPNVYDFDYMEKEEKGLVPKSALAGEVIFGNNYGKKSLDKTYLAEALGTGNVTIKTMHRVDDIIEEDGIYHLQVSILSAYGEVVKQKNIKTQYLIMGAGSLGTTELLVKSKVKGNLSGLNESIGKGWGGNGNIMTALANKLKNPTGAKQSTIPVAGIDNWDNSELSAFAEIAPLPMGIQNWISLYLAITNNPERANFIYDSIKDKVVLDWKKSQMEPSKKAAQHLFDQLKKQTLGYRNDLFGDKKKFSDDFTYHPLGGCVLGKATDLYGRVYGQKNFYIMDGSLIPGVIGVNPYVTITALAERNIEKIISEDFL